MKNEPIVMPSPEMVEEYVNKAVKAAKIQQLEQLKAEIREMRSKQNCSCSDCLDILDNHIEELKGDNKNDRK